MKLPSAALAGRKNFNMFYQTGVQRSPAKEKNPNLRIRAVWAVFLLAAAVLIWRLAVLMLYQHDFYTALSAGSHEFYNNLFPSRGTVYIQDARSKEEYPLAMNKDFFLLYADTRAIKNNETAEKTAEKLAEIFQYDDEKKIAVYLALNKRTDPYEPIENKIEEKTAEQIKSLNLPGLNFVRRPARYYPEGNLASTVIGFLGKDSQGNDIGRYGVEGYWQKELAGSGGFLSGVKAAVGGIIPLAGWSLKQAEDGADILLTIDRTLQYQACERLSEARENYGAVSASLVIIEPSTGAIRAMCSTPDFDPNNYNKVEAVDFYNNTSIFTPYEPGSVFKPLTMAGALQEGVVTPETTFYDSGERAGLCAKPIKNAMERSYGVQNMSQVLEKSINTGVVFAVEKLGKKKFLEYVENFGFGIKEGIELDSEASGDISSLSKNKKDSLDCYTATASFGQGITATPLQMAAAFGAIANGGKLMKPYIVEEVRYSDGKIDRFKPKEIRQVIDSRTAMLVRGMMVNVVENGQAKSAGVKGYFVGGKTGTAQIPGQGGYSQETNHSFAGMAPADDPKFVMFIKFEKPKRAWADSTAAPLFGELAKFILQYYQIPPSR